MLRFGAQCACEGVHESRDRKASRGRKESFLNARSRPRMCLQKEEGFLWAEMSEGLHGCLAGQGSIGWGGSPLLTPGLEERRRARMLVSPCAEARSPARSENVYAGGGGCA